MTSSPRAAAGAVAVLFLALHLPYLPASLEDLDSVNAALALRAVDAGARQPLPPGNVLFVAAGRIIHLAIANEARALGLLSGVAAALGALAAFALFQRIDERWPPGLACAAMAVAMTSPIYWFTAARPLGDAAGLSAALFAQSGLLAASALPALNIAAFGAALAVGVRAQTFWLTTPLFVYVVRGWRRKERRRALWQSALAYVAGLCGWGVPLIVLSGGLSAYWRAMLGRRIEEVNDVRTLWTSPGVRELTRGLYYLFVAPWALWSVAAVVIVFALVGGLLMARYARHAAVVLLVAFAPYVLFALLFQQGGATRYALPLVVPMAYLAVRGAAAFGWRPGLAVAVIVSMFNAHIGGTSIAAYARQKAPAFQLLDDMQRATSHGGAPAIAMDRRESLDLRQPLAWTGRRAVGSAERLASPPQHEWLQAVGYWLRGGRRPVWFIADPLRADVDLIQHGDPVKYRWRIPYPELIAGVRPNEMDWYSIAQPEWFVGPGWALNLEAEELAERSRSGLAYGPISGRVRGDAWAGGALALGGRNLDPAQHTVSVAIGDRLYSGEIAVAPGVFAEILTLPLTSREPEPAASGSPGTYDTLIVSAGPGAHVAIDQFDVSNTRAVWLFGDGWQAQEWDPATGARWRWLSEKGEILVHDPGRVVRLHIEGESPRHYFSRPSRLIVRAGRTVALDETIGADFSFDVTLPRDLFGAPVSTITFETDQVYVPAERSSRSADRRHLGLRILRCEVRSADSPVS